MNNDNFIKNIISKDKNLSQKAVKQLIETADKDLFEKLCKNSEYIFPFIKEKIIRDFIKIINRQNLNCVFEFTKIYCSDYEDLIVKSWLKFADEDLTDKILLLLESGTNEQKAYAALYFKYIKDPLALDGLRYGAKSEYDPLRINCARTLGEFKDKIMLEEEKNTALNSLDDFEKLKAYEFISAYGGEDSIRFISQWGLDNILSENIVISLLDFNDIENLKILDEEKIIRIFTILLEAYPENISLDTLCYYRILDFIKLIQNFDSQYAKNSLIIAKSKFEEFKNADIYSFDLDKNSKEELKKICSFLNSLDIKPQNLEFELKQYNSPRYLLALDVIKELKLVSYCEQLAQLINSNFLKNEALALTVSFLNQSDKAFLIDKHIVDNIENANLKALVESYM